MKKKFKKGALVFPLIMLSMFSNAQLNGMLNKAKDKAKEKISENKTEPQTNTNMDSKTTTEANEEINPNVTFEWPYQAVDYSSPISELLSEMLTDNNKISPFQHIRKKGESGATHFAKDYPELEPILVKQAGSLKIEFFDALPNSGTETFGTSFSSQQHIYARITALSGTIKDVFQLDENNAILNVRMNLYDDEKEQIKQSNGFFNTIFLSKEEANFQWLDIEILPHNMKFSMFKSKEGDYYLSPFPNMHDQANFYRNGKYQVGFFIYSQQTDDWGKVQEGESNTQGAIFEYDFAAKDVAAIKSDQNAVADAKQRGIKFEKKPLPIEWSETSSDFTMGYSAKQISDLYVNSYDGGDKVLTVIKCFAHPSNGGWSIQKNEFGIPEYSYSNQFYTLFVKNSDGSCFFQRFSLRQKYTGGGTYSAVFGDITYDVHFTDCEKMK